MSERFTPFDAAGNAAMVDVSDKPATDRTATAQATVVMAPATLAMIQEGTAKKGDVLGVARLAGIMAAKRTADLIPLCHPLPITSVKVDLVPDPASGVPVSDGIEPTPAQPANRILAGPRAEKPVALASYGMDLHEAQRIVHDGVVCYEGKGLGGPRVAGPYPVGYGAIVP